jgi:hypothetical protein
MVSGRASSRRSTVNAVPIALAFIGAMSVFGCWTVFLAQDSVRRAAVQSSPLPAEPERRRAPVVAPALRLHRVDEPRSPARRPVTRLAVFVIAGLIVVSALAGGPRPPTRGS